MSAEGEGGGGHGGNWIVTYADMITLLMAGFIVIVTFGSRETDKLAPRNDSVVGASSGSGIVGMLRKGPDKDHVVVRRPPMAGTAFDQGSEMAPLYSDVPLDVAKAVEASLELPKVGRLSDTHEISYPLTTLFDHADELSPTGISRLQEVSRQMRQLPQDILIQVSNPNDYVKAIRVYQYLFQVCEISPLRLAVGRKPAAQDNGMLMLTFRHPPAAR